MQRISTEVAAVIKVSIVFWGLLIGTILIAGHWWRIGREFRDTLLQQWKPSLIIALLYMLSEGIGGTHVFPFYSIVIFCQAMIGLALAYSIAGFEPLPGTQAMNPQKKWLERLYPFLSGIVLLSVS